MRVILRRQAMGRKVLAYASYVGFARTMPPPAETGRGRSAYCCVPAMVHRSADPKPMIDFAFASGINCPVIHTSVRQPVDDKKPGRSLAMSGHFNRHSASPGETRIVIQLGSWHSLKRIPSAIVSFEICIFIVSRCQVENQGPAAIVQVVPARLKVTDPNFPVQSRAPHWQTHEVRPEHAWLLAPWRNEGCPP